MTDSVFMQETVFPMIVSALAAYRMARMVVSETGPFAIFARLRRHIDPQQKTWIGIGLNCPYCIGLWSSLLFYWLLAYNQNTTAQFLINVLAIAGVQTIIQSWEPIPPPPPDLQNANGNSHQVTNNGNTATIDSQESQEVKALSK